MADITLNELAYEILGNYRANRRDTDSLDIREVHQRIENTRAMLIKEKVDRQPGYSLDQSYIQELQSVEMISVDSSASPIRSGRNIRRSKLTIPRPIELYGDMGIISRVGPADRYESNYNYISYDRAIWAGNGMFNANNIYAFTLNDYMFLISKADAVKEVKYINIRGAFSKPAEVILWNDSTADYTDIYDSQYPINKAMAKKIVDIVIESIRKYNMFQIEDTNQDEADSTVNAQIKK